MRKTAPPASPALRGIKIALRVLFFALLIGLIALILSESPSLSDLIASRPTPDALRVALVAGHWQSDSGAVCADGLQEVELNLQIARGVADRLRTRGYEVEVLPEYSYRLTGYQADVFLSIHNDSCTVKLSGFKVARSDSSNVPSQADELVRLLYTHYAEATDLEPHPDTITTDMTEYHAWRQIDPATPAAIIECGFMGGDRQILTDGQERVVNGIVNALIAFLQPAANTPTP